MSSEDDELLTENDDEEYQPTPGKKEFSIYRPLDPPITKQWSVADLHDLMHQGLIDLEAPYQRDVVWPDNKKIDLIDSIFRNFSIPPVIFSIHVDDEGTEIRVCVDGKQRLTSISKFMDDRDQKSKRKFWFKRSTSQPSRALLPETFQKKFKHKQLTCIEYTNLSPSDERDLFQRVQLGMSLTPAEKLQANASVINDWINTLERRFVTADNGLEQNLNWNVARGKGYLGVAQLCYCCWHLPQFALPSSVKLGKWIRTAPEPSKPFKKQVQRVLESYAHISMREEYRQGFSQIKEPVSPLEFFMIGVLLAKMRACTWDERAQQILAMRKHVRSLYKDIRTNERVMKSMWLFIDQISHKGATYEDWEGPLTNPASQKKTTTTARKTTQTQKRRRIDAEDSMNNPGPSKRQELVTNTGSATVESMKHPKRPDGDGVRFVA